jgi:hypothetical protein
MIDLLWQILLFVACAIGFTVMGAATLIIIMLWMGEPRR